MCKLYVNGMTHSSANATDWATERWWATCSADSCFNSSPHRQLREHTDSNYEGGSFSSQRCYWSQIKTNVHGVNWRYNVGGSHVVYPVDPGCRAFRGAQLVSRKSLRQENLVAPTTLDNNSPPGVVRQCFDLYFSPFSILIERPVEERQPAINLSAFCASPLSQ